MMKRVHTPSPLVCVGAVGLAASLACADDLLLAVIEFDGLPTGIRMLDPVSGALLGDFVPADFENNGMLFQVEAISAGPSRTVLFGQPGGQGVITQYDENGNFMGVYLGGTPDPNPVDNIRSMAVSADGRFLYTSDWDGTDDVHRFLLSDASPMGVGGDPLGTLITGSQPAPGLDQPQAIEILQNGQLLVGDLGAGQLTRYNAETGALIGKFTTTPMIASIQDLDQLPDGTVVSTESGSGNRIRRFAADGTLLSSFGFTSPDGVHVLPNGDYLVGSGSSFGQGKGLFRVAPDGTILETIDSSRGYGAIELVTLLEPGCPADLAPPSGVLNFFDLGEFLTRFNAQDPSVDFAAPFGVFNFFDLGEFLTLFNQGCP